jgi:hypothetical protein
VRVGVQTPRLSRIPAFASNDAADDVITMAEVAGMPLDEWQKWIARNSLGELNDGRWAAFEVGIDVPRQNGKSALIEALILAALFVWQERTVIYSAHLFSSAQETFTRLRSLIEQSEFADEVAKVYTANGKEAIILKNGCRVKFMARSRGGGRGFSGDRIIFDEAFDLDPKALGAMVPALAARSMRGDSNPQIWYVSSAPHADSVVFHSVRSRALSEADPGRLFYASWSADELAEADNVEAWYQANPALGIRISEDFVRDEMQALSHSPEEFLRERLGIPDMPITDKVAPPAIPADAWQATATTIPHDVAPGGCVFAYDVHDGWASIAIAAGTLSAAYVEVVAHQAGDGWLPRRLVELAERWKPISIGLDGGNGPAVAVLGVAREQFEEAGLNPDLLRPITSADYKAACGSFLRSVVDGTLTRPVVAPDQLDNAAVVASERRIGDAFVWDRRTATVPLAPLVAVTLARSLLGDKPPKLTHSASAFVSLNDY